MTAQEFWDLVYLHGPTPESDPALGKCWLWCGYIDEDGYGKTSLNGRSEGAHRIAYKLTYGNIPKGLCIDHLCRVRNCVNPKHLEVVSNTENVLRGVGLTAKNAKKTHCPRGHAYDARGTGKKQNPWRKCRVCQLMHNQNYRARRRAAHNAK